MDTKTLMLANMIGNISVVLFMLAYNRNHLNRVNRDHFISQVMFSIIRFCDQMRKQHYYIVLASSTVIAIFSSILRILADFSNLRIGTVTLTIAIYLTISSAYLLKNKKKSHLQSIIACALYKAKTKSRNAVYVQVVE